jgi:hypothetical protein
MYNLEMNTKVISAFPGTGKTFFVNSVKDDRTVLDLDSSRYTRGHDINGRAISRDFPTNYTNAIKEQLGCVDILFVSIHKEVMIALFEEDIKFSLVYPDNRLKHEYLDRFKLRGSPDSFVNLFSKNWDVSLEQLKSQKGCRHIVLKSNEYISDIVRLL